MLIFSSESQTPLQLIQKLHPSTQSHCSTAVFRGFAPFQMTFGTGLVDLMGVCSRVSAMHFYKYMNDGKECLDIFAFLQRFDCMCVVQ